MQRVLTTATLVGLLVATAAAFAITERLKLVKSPIYGTVISPVFSPTAGQSALIRLKFRHRDHVTVTVLAGRSLVVRSLALGELVPRGQTVFRWNGKTDRGTQARDGSYRVQVHLRGQHRTILLPNVIALDTTPPEVIPAAPNHEQISPDGDKLADSVSIRYRLSKPAHVVVYLRGHRIVRTHSAKVDGAFEWSGRLNGKLLPPGTYVLSIGAVDPAGNATPVAARAHVPIEIRYIRLASRQIAGVGPGKRFDIGVSTDAESYTWRLGARHGRASGSVLHLRAPAKAGRYRLVVTERGHSDAASVIVR